MSRPVPLALACLLALTTVAAVALSVGSLAGQEPTRPGATTVAAQPAGSRALRVLHGWDRRRARAWSHGSVRQLRALYGRGSGSGAADCAMLAAYRERGLRVGGMRRQTLAVRELEATGRGLTLRVTDRLVSAVAVGDGIRQRLPQDAYASQTLTFRRTPRGWVRTG